MDFVWGGHCKKFRVLFLNYSGHFFPLKKDVILKDEGYFYATIGMGWVKLGHILGIIAGSWVVKNNSRRKQGQ